MPKHLVLIGGGHAHMVTLANISSIISKGHRVTVIGPSDHHYYSGMGPGMLGGTYRPDEIRFATRQVVEKQGGAFLRNQAVAIDPEAKTVALANGEKLSYDVLSCNAGSQVPLPPMEGDLADIFTVKPIERLMAAQTRLIDHFNRQQARIVIAGGGPSAAEVAGNVWQLARDNGRQMPHITICAGNTFMPRFPSSVRRKTIRLLNRRSIHIREGAYVKGAAAGSVTLDSGERLPANFTFMALGVRPSPIFANSGMETGPDGGLPVNRFLQSTQHPDIFGGGDCIYFEDAPLDKVGVYAVRQNPILLQNIVARMEGRELTPFDPGGDYLLIFNLGGGAGVLKKRWLEFSGRTAFWIKDAIDRKFMRRFQAMEQA